MHYRSKSANLVICEYCDAVYTRLPLQHREIARCQQCGSQLYRKSRTDINVMLALTLASAITFVIANSFPIIELDMQGLSNQATLWDTIMFTLESNVGAIAILAASAAFFFPLIQILLFAYVLIPLRAGRKPYALIGAMHALREMQPWSMVEVFMLGAVVSVVKLTAVATVAPQLGLWGFAALTILLTVLSSFDLHELWNQISELEE
jgi:paraquat-inducible protein A